jgi:hypothetical protein
LHSDDPLFILLNKILLAASRLSNSWEDPILLADELFKP